MSDDKIVDFQKIKDQIEANIKDASAFSNEDPNLAKMNAKHAFIKSYGGKPLITSYVYNSAFNKEILEFITPKNIEIIYCNETVQVTNRGGVSNVPLGKWWLQHAERREYKTVIFDPAKPQEYDNCLNLWEGFSTTPKKGIWKWTLKHIYTILCNSDPVKFKYVIKWFAWSLQNPGERATVCLCFKGLKGSGKGFLLSQFVNIFGRHGMHISNREHLTGKFNGHLGLCSFLFADEAYYPGDRQVEGTLKQLITEERIAIENKGLPVIISKNNLHIVMATNNDWSVPASGDERRFFINCVEDKYAKNKTSDLLRNLYFSRLFIEMDTGGREAMLYDLLNMKLDDWHPRDGIPDTEELKSQVRLSRSKLHSAVFSILEDGIFPGYFSNLAYNINATELYSYLETIEPVLKHVSTVRKSTVIKELGAKKIRGVEGNIWVFPPLKEMRNNWDSMYGKEKWDDNEEWQVIKTPF